MSNVKNNLKNLSIFKISVYMVELKKMVKRYAVDMPHGGYADRWTCRQVDMPHLILKEFANF